MFDPKTPRNGKFSLEDIREYFGYYRVIYGILKELGWKVPWGHLFTAQEAYQILMFRHTRIGRKLMHQRKFRRQLPQPEGRPMRADPHDILPPEPYTPQPKGFVLGTKRSLTRPKAKTSPPSSKQADPKG